MSRFDHYFQMNVGDVIEYTLEKTTEIPWDRDSMEAVVPPSHGNLNYVTVYGTARAIPSTSNRPDPRPGYPRI